jgi:hypothetical protein
VLMMNRCIGTVARMGGTPAVLTEFVDSLADLIQWNAQYLCGPGEYVYYPRPPKVNIHDVARNILADSMRGGWLLMLDSDHAFEPDLCSRLINVAEQTRSEVVTGLYTFRQPPHSPVLYRYHNDALHPLGDWDERLEVMPVDSAGAGCLLVYRSVFDRIKAELNEEPFSRIGGCGEDNSFFLRLRKLGIPAVCATKVECHHLQVRPLSLSDYRRDHVELKAPETVTGWPSL